MDKEKISQLDPAAWSVVARNVLDDCFHNIIHDMVLEIHREEKVLRMQSAVVIAEDTARAQMPEPPVAPVKGAPPPTPNIRVETTGAIYENGKTFLRGNPLQTTPEVICPQCRLPRLQYPITGKGSREPDLSKEYCMFYPFVSKPGHDIYGNQFPTEQAKTKKERELIKQQQRAEKDNTPGSNDTGTPPATQSFTLNTGSKPISYIPWQTCPSCKRSLLITRFAQHLEKCLGISGRQSSRNAMAKLTGNGSVSGNTPLGSRMGTPQPGSQNNNGKRSPTKKGGADDDDDDDKETPVKKKKKSNYIKKADRERLAASGATTPGSTHQSDPKIKLKIAKPKSGDNGVKREREDGDGEVPRKKIKMQRSESIRTEKTEGDDEGSDDELGA
ncbi:hypothetical protein EJ05DRAFT_211256 [Pseudovirgaria hyperparasitica]|uniref:SAGA-associated factor 11 n=1 Tax=Pseudovirgaria hyperparasitica TaxID=470096 RepID=A0A6A6VT48_9PEZI|nr:uncharacterized protein EJ05DRAFT_211256 [Pseudovirgaria hyperparasitica]KAF2753325.1 hypothetical protein EJ05DRAFT_211256 [Pseudovirgaria hyperparasitica]